MTSDLPDARPPNRSGPARLVALLGIVVLAGLMVWVASAIRSHNAVQNCIDSGRRDCVELQ